MYLIHKAKQVKKVKNFKIKKVQTKRFRPFAIIRVENDRPHACIYLSYVIPVGKSLET